MKRSEWYNERDERTFWCLGQPSHMVQAGRVLCQICGHLVAGASLGTYHVQQFLGNGRSGSAYLAIHLRQRHPVVVKVFPADQTARELWPYARQEISAVAQIRHASILPVLSCAPQQLETQRDDSISLDARIASATGRGASLITIRHYVPYSLPQFLGNIERMERPRTNDEWEGAMVALLLKLIQQAGSALHAAHVLGIVHGALVPGNLLVDGQEHIWVADFGLARLHPPQPPYLAPELSPVSHESQQRRNMAAYWNAVTAASDQYTFAILCQHLLARILQPEHNEQAVSVLQRATDPNPTRRFPSLATFVSELVMQVSRKRTALLPGESPEHKRQGIRVLPRVGVVRDEGGVPLARVSGQEQGVRVQNSAPVGASPPPRTEAWEKLGGKLFTAHDYSAAREAYQHAVALNATSATLWVALGDACLADGQYAEALTAYQQAVALDPNDPLAWSNRGAALDALGQHREAAACYERASQLSAQE